MSTDACWNDLILCFAFLTYIRIKVLTETVSLFEKEIVFF